MVSRGAFTLFEILIVIAMVAATAGLLAYLFIAVISAWNLEYARAGQGAALDRAVSEVARDLRMAKAVLAAGAGEVRFTSTDSSSYVYYLYNPSDTYPQVFDKGLYQLKKAPLSPGIDGTFTYGGGSFTASYIEPPPVSVFSVGGNIVTIDLTTNRNGIRMRQATQVRPRNG